jgi:hypothetical protein
MSRISPLTGRISRAACRRRGPRSRDRITRRRAAIAQAADRHADHPGVRVLPGREIPPALPRKAWPPRPRSRHPVNGPPGRPRRSAYQSCARATKAPRSAEGLSPVPPAPGRTGRKPVGRGRRTPWQRSTFAAQTHQGRCTRYAVTDVVGRIPTEAETARRPELYRRSTSTRSFGGGPSAKPQIAPFCAAVSPLTGPILGEQNETSLHLLSRGCPGFLCGRRRRDGSSAWGTGRRVVAGPGVACPKSRCCGV